MVDSRILRELTKKVKIISIRVTKCNSRTFCIWRIMYRKNLQKEKVNAISILLEEIIMLSIHEECQ